MAAASRSHDRNPGGSIAAKAYQRLRGAIVECKLAPGQRVTESSIAQKLQVGETPAREALRQLVLERLVQVTPRHGYIVAPITLRDVDELFELRLMVEPAAAALAARNSSDVCLAPVKKLSEIGYSPEDHESVRKFLRANTEFHAHIAVVSGNRRMAQLLAQLLSESERLIHFGVRTHPQSEQTVAEHQKLLEVLVNGDSDSARHIVEKHLAATRQMVIESLLTNSRLREIPIGV